MKVVNIHEAKTHLSKLVSRAAKGEEFVIARAGKPLVKLVPLHPPARSGLSRLGFLEGKIKVPDDFDDMGRSEIERAFEGRE